MNDYDDATLGADTPGGSPPCMLSSAEPSYAGLPDAATRTPPLRDADGQAVAADDEGFLVDPESWDREVAEQIAARCELVLESAHWQVLEFMRSYYAEHQVAADARHVIRHMATELGLGRAARNRLYALFPYGYVQQACRIAGMKRPRAWSTG